MSHLNLTPEHRQEIAWQLASARQAVGAARIAGDHGAEAEARSRMHLARRALGTPKTTWWDDC